MTAVILHLSDIHIKMKDDPILSQGESIGVCTYSSLPSASHIFIVISGDIAFSGEEEQYGLAATFLKEISETIEKETSCPISFIVTPGNHDCDFSKNDGARKMLLENIEKSDSPEIDSSIINNCTSVQESFFTFRNNLEANIEAVDDRLWRSSHFDVEGRRLTFDCLNVSWVSKVQEDPGKLFFPINRYTGKEYDKSVIRFIVLHHPLNWFHQAIYRPFRKFVRELSDIVISGHEHQGNTGVIKDTESNDSAFVEGCVLQNDQNLSDSSFNIIVIDIADNRFTSKRYNWNGNRYVVSEDESLSDYCDLPAIHKNPFIIQESFQKIMDDPGAYFKHPGSTSITLSDIFVYPDLRKVDNPDNKRREFVSASRLLSPDVIAGGILIEGEEKAGSTSLLYQLFRQYHEHGYVPVLLNGKDLKSTNEAEIDSKIRRAIKNQYGDHQIPAYEQLQSSQKLLLLDHFDDGPIKTGDARANLLCLLRKRFGCFVVTVSEMFEMSEMLDGDASKVLISLEHYQMQHFNYTLRSQLIQRWFSLGADGCIDESTLISQCDQAEKLMNIVMNKKIIPSHPLYLLTLLQSIDAGRGGDFKESALGYYYQYLLSEALQKSGVSPDKLNEVFSYVMHLAWEFHVLGNRELSETELRSFNTRFSKMWHTVDFSKRLTLLINARVLRRVGEEYAFHYPYIYYYLKGMYLSKNLSDLDNRAYIQHCCDHLYVRDYANTVLFLAHHSNDYFILDSIVNSVQRLFNSFQPVTFKGDTDGINTIINKVPDLSYSGETPSEYRKRRNLLKDELDDGCDGLVEVEEKSDELSVISQITMLFKAADILGQILKNQYANIQRNDKADLLMELFNGPLRALRSMYDSIGENPESLAADIEATLIRLNKNPDSDKVKIYAQRIAAGIIQTVTFAFVFKAAQSANSANLQEDVEAVVNRNNTLAFRLIELCIKLDSPKAIPRRMIKIIKREAMGDHVALRLINIMILNRLYMYKTTEQDMQWLSKEVDIKLDVQHAITYQDSKHRLT